MASAEKPRSLKELSLEQLGNVEVTSVKKEPEKVWRTSAAIFVITQQDIQRAGVTSIADALRLAPGVEVSRISSTTWAIGIRGLQSNFSKSVLVLVDGRSVYTPLFAGVYWDVQDLVLEDIDRIEVIRGPGGIIWGPNAVNGVINIITKHTSDTHGALVSVSGGTVDRTINEIRYGSGVGNFNYRVYAKGFYRSHEFHKDLANRNFDAWHQERGGFRTDYQRGTDNYTVQGDIYGGDSPHLLGTQVSDDAVSGGNVLARWRRTINDHSDFYLQTSFDRTIRSGVQLGETRNTFDIDFVHHLRVGARHDISYGGGLRWSPNHVISKNAAVAVLPPINTDHDHSLFAQDDIGFFDNKLVVTGGIKLQHNNFSGWDAQPTARVLWNRSQGQSFWAAVTRAVTTPSRIEEGFLLSGRVSPALELQVVGNPMFRSEALVGYEGGYRQLFRKDFFIDLAVFHNDYRDLQSFGAPQTSVAATPPPPHLLIQIPYANAIGGETNGFEIAPSWKPTDFWKLSGSYSYVGINLHANAPTSDISSTGSVATYEGSTPHHQVEALSSIDLPRNLSFSQFYRYASELPAQKVRAYSTLDLQLAWTYHSQFTLAIVGQNLLQPYHEEWGTGDPTQQNIAIRRGAYVKLVWSSK